MAQFELAEVMKQSVRFVRQLSVTEFHGWIAYYGIARDRQKKAGQRARQRARRR